MWGGRIFIYQVSKATTLEISEIYSTSVPPLLWGWKNNKNIDREEHHPVSLWYEATGKKILLRIKKQHLVCSGLVFGEEKT